MTTAPAPASKSGCGRNHIIRRPLLPRLFVAHLWRLLCRSQLPVKKHNRQLYPQTKAPAFAVASVGFVEQTQRIDVLAQGIDALGSSWPVSFPRRSLGSRLFDPIPPKAGPGARGALPMNYAHLSA